MGLIQIAHGNGLWHALCGDWRSQCVGFNEDFETFAIDAMSVLNKLSSEPEQRAGVFALQRDDGFELVCQLNCTHLPGYSGPVLRLRHLTLSPNIDFGERPEEEYGNLLINLFNQVYLMSEIDPFRADHIKFHLRSPGDRRFFREVGAGLENSGQFQAVRIAGSWLLVTK